MAMSSQPLRPSSIMSSPIYSAKMSCVSLCLFAIPLTLLRFSSSLPFTSLIANVVVYFSQPLKNSLIHVLHTILCAGYIYHWNS